MAEKIPAAILPFGNPSFIPPWTFLNAGVLTLSRSTCPGFPTLLSLRAPPHWSNSTISFPHNPFIDAPFFTRPLSPAVLPPKRKLRQSKIPFLPFSRILFFPTTSDFPGFPTALNPPYAGGYFFPPLKFPATPRQKECDGDLFLFPHVLLPPFFVPPSLMSTFRVLLHPTSVFLDIEGLPYPVQFPTKPSCRIK